MRRVKRAAPETRAKRDLRRERRERLLLPAFKLRENLADHVAVHIGQTPIDAVVAHCQPRVVDAQQVQDRGMHVVDLGGMLAIGRLESPLIARPVRHAAPNAAAAQPIGEAIRIMVAPLAPLR